ncbi:tetratricopeptide repeat protein [candidate division WOR-3 bacterium]|nr:tetratricopeptide repeat protein [candidate division WOR-3 bacterium]
MKCPKCGAENSHGAKFCDQCGNPIGLKQEVQPTQKVDTSKTNLVLDSSESRELQSDERLVAVRSLLPSTLAEKIRRESKKIKGERKYVTVMFADISGFTSFSERLEPEDLTNLMNQCFSALSKVIYKYEGTIDKFIGDCVMVLFGAPITQEDSTERAIRCAFDMIEEIKKLSSYQAIKQFESPFSLHIGINAGWVIAGSVGSNLKMEYTVMGDTVNLAERLTELAEEGEILVSEPIFRDTKSTFVFKSRALIKIRGKEKKINVYELRGFQEVKQAQRGILGLSSPIIGRDNELGVLDSLMDRISDKSYAISLIGEAGVGKSRLIQELKNVRDNFFWWHGKCPSYGKSLPFGVFIEGFKSWLGIGESSGMEQLLIGKVNNLFGEESKEILPYLLTFLGLKVPEPLDVRVRWLNAESLRLQIFASIRRLFIRLCKEHPLILYLEDLHWVDAESVDLIKFLLGTLMNKPILFLFEFREEKESRAYQIKEAVSEIFKWQYLELTISPLSSSAGDQLIAHLLKSPKFPSDLRHLILKNAGGNPFYIEEFLKSLIDKDIISYQSGTWKVNKPIQKIEIPDSIEVIIGSRIDRLSSAEKSVLQSASVIGKSFLHQVLEYVSEVEDLNTQIAELIDKEFIFKTNGNIYQFRHPLIRDVAYNSLLKQTSRELHRRVGTCIEDIFSENLSKYYQFLAYHYYEGANWGRAFFYCKQAAEDAKENYNNLSAIEHYTRALNILDDSLPEMDKKEKAELLEKIGDVKRQIGRYDEALIDYNRACEYREGIEEKASLIGKLGTIFYKKGEYKEATNRYELAINMLENKFPSSPVLAETIADYAFLLSEGKGKYEQAETLILQALELISKDKESKLSARCYGSLGTICLRKGKYDDALAYYQKAASIHENLENKGGIAGILNNIGIIYRHKGELERALENYKRALLISNEIGYKGLTGSICVNTGVVYSNKGDLERAIEYYKKSLDISEAVGNKKGVGIAYGNIGAVYENKGDLTQALEYYQKSLEISKAIGDKAEIGRAYENIGGIWYEKGELEQALKYYKKCLNIFGYKRGIGITWCDIGKTQTELGKLKEAHKSLNSAEEFLRETGDKISLSRVYANFSELSPKENKIEEAISFARKSWEYAKDTGAKKEQIISLRILGTSLDAAGKKGAIEHLRKSITIAKQSNLKLEFAKSSYELGKLLHDKGKDLEARKLLVHSKEIFQKSGASLWLKKFNALSGRE